MSEPSRLPSATIDSDPNVNYVSNLAEKVVEVLIRHLEGHVADEEGLGRGVGFSRLSKVALSLFVILNGHAAASEEMLIQTFNGCSGVVQIFKFHIAKPKSDQVSTRWKEVSALPCEEIRTLC